MLESYTQALNRALDKYDAMYQGMNIYLHMMVYQQQKN